VLKGIRKWVANLSATKSSSVVVLSDNGGELNHFFERVRREKKIVVQLGDDLFDVVLKPKKLPEGVRAMLLRGGPMDDE
jgi:hypothetical protein